MKTLKVFALMIAVLIGGLMLVGWISQLFNGGGSADRGREIAWIDKGRDAVRAQLRDGESARFRNSFFNRGEDGIPVACGQVNAKNALGGYVGFQRFVYIGRGGTYLEEQVSDFSNLWRRFCL